MAVLARSRRVVASSFNLLRARSPLRPLVLIQSDDWGRVGIPSRDTIERLQLKGADVGRSKWDYYGLETPEDVTALGDLLDGIRDETGTPACMTANFVMANADLPRMRNEGFGAFRWKGIDDGFPEPWRDDLVPAYRDNIRKGVFEPGLHGFTHFNVRRFMTCLNEDSERGRRARLLVENDVPYLASLTPEYNFALVARGDEEIFLDRNAQRDWIGKGIRLFGDVFGAPPRTTCAPGYRANRVTLEIWAEAGIEAMQTVGTSPPEFDGGLFAIQRNVSFEPALDDGDMLEAALRDAKRAAARGTPIVICTHSINYIARFLGGAGHSRELLASLLKSLLGAFPGLRFVGSVPLARAAKSSDDRWFRSPSAPEVLLRQRDRFAFR